MKQLKNKYHVSTTLLDILNPETNEMEYFITIEELEQKLHKNLNVEILLNKLKDNNINYRFEKPEYTNEEFLTFINKNEAIKFINLLNKNKI